MVEEEWTPCAEAEFEVEVTPFSLPEQELIRYEWFHADALCSCYRVAAWSEEHWEIIERFACNAVRHGINALYTPLWTPPLDTEVNGERPTCQLLDIAYDPATRSYRFDFGKLERFLDMGLRLGFKKFGMSHLFTQWGAKFTPKIICTLPDGREEKRFGWHVAADDPSYAEFLRALLPKLIAFFRKKGIAERCFFSISDEPCEEQKESYSRAVNLARPLLEGIPTVEALSRIEFYEAGLVQHPVPSCNILESFQGRVKDLWTYYCCGQQQQTPNRFMAMPSARVRVRVCLPMCMIWRDSCSGDSTSTMRSIRGNRSTRSPAPMRAERFRRETLFWSIRDRTANRSTRSATKCSATGCRICGAETARTEDRARSGARVSETGTDGAFHHDGLSA